MIKAVIFDMFETLITHYNSPLYFGSQMAVDAKLSDDKFLPLWRQKEDDRTLGKITLEENLAMILRENNCYSADIIKKLADKRRDAKRKCFENMHPEIIPMLSSLKEKGLLIGLISNCFSEEAEVIRESILFEYFDAVCLSCEMGVCKPDKRIFQKCLDILGVSAEECLYVGDGGCYELETAQSLGMKPIQAAWYLKEGTKQPSKIKPEFSPASSPQEIAILYC